MHSGEKSNNCSQCDYASFRADRLRTLLKTHSGEKAKQIKETNVTETTLRMGPQIASTSKQHCRPGTCTCVLYVLILV